MGIHSDFSSIYFRCGENEDLTREVQVFRKTVFVDERGWSLRHSDGRERDEFDDGRAVYCALFRSGRIVATFRALRTDGPYLAERVFPQLAVTGSYPHRADVWEITRFGVDPQADIREVGLLNYALMFRFARRVGAASLVAIADLAYERFLRGIGIRTRRFGPPQSIGADARGRDMLAVAGEIAIAAQDPDRIAALLSLLDDVEISDVWDVRGPVRATA